MACTTFLLKRPTLSKGLLTQYKMIRETQLWMPRWSGLQRVWTRFHWHASFTLSLGSPVPTPNAGGAGCGLNGFRTVERYSENDWVARTDEMLYTWLMITQVPNLNVKPFPHCWQGTLRGPREQNTNFLIR